MKKILFVLAICMSAVSVKSFAGWEYCSYSQQTTSDSWNVYIQQTWMGGGMPANPRAEYRYDRYDAISQTFVSTGWVRLPAGGFIGVTGMGTGISNLEIRHRHLLDPTAPPLLQLFVGSC